MKVIIDDIPETLHAMVDIVGMEKFLEICKLYGGCTLYIPVYKQLLKGKRNRDIIKAYNGRNIDDLRYKFGISSQQIKRLLVKHGLE